MAVRAVRLTAHRDQIREARLRHLGDAYEQRFELSRVPADLNAAVDAYRAAVDACPDGLPDRALDEHDLARTLLARGDLPEARTVWRAAASRDVATVPVRLAAAEGEASAAVAAGDFADAETAFRLALTLVARLGSFGLPRQDRERQLSEWPGLAGDAAAVALGAGRTAERTGAYRQWPVPALAADAATAGRPRPAHHGRSWSRSPATRGRCSAAGPGTWSRASRTGDRINWPWRQVRTPPHGPLHGDLYQYRNGWNDSGVAAALSRTGRAAEGRATVTQGDEGSAVDRRMALAREWDALVEEVRMLDGFEDFLRPPSIEQLLPAAEHGPVVVVNVSRWRCDALVVRTSGVTPVNLPGLTLDDATRRAEEYLSALQSVDVAADAYLQSLEPLGREPGRGPSPVRRRAGAGGCAGEGRGPAARATGVDVVGDR